jgi:thymidylate synthase (FAD)
MGVSTVELVHSERTSITLTDRISVEEYQQKGSDLDIVAAAWVSSHVDLAADRLRGEGGERRMLGTLRALMRDRHGTPFEEGYLSITVEVPLWLMREWQRHRTQSYSEMSQRYVRLLPHFWFPGRQRPLVIASDHKQMRPSYQPLPGGQAGDREYAEMRDDWQIACQLAWDTYEKWLERGRPREVAARVLGVNVYTRCRVRLNPRSIMHFLSLRTHEDRPASAVWEWAGMDAAVAGPTDVELGDSWNTGDPWALCPSYPQYEIEQAARMLESIFARHWPVTQQMFCDFGRVAP